MPFSRAVELGIEADAELDERRHPPRHPDRPRVGPVDRRHDLQQAALARPVAPDDREEFALVDLERDPAQRMELAVLDSRQRMGGALLDRVHLLVGNPERLLDAPGLDHDRSMGRCASVGRHDVGEFAFDCRAAQGH